MINGQSNPYSPYKGGHYQYIDISRRSVNSGTNAKKVSRGIDSYHVGPMIDSISGPDERADTDKFALPKGRAVQSLSAMVPYVAQKLARDGDAWQLPPVDLSDLQSVYKLKRARYFAYVVDDFVTNCVTNKLVSLLINIFKVEFSTQH